MTHSAQVVTHGPVCSELVALMMWGNCSDPHKGNSERAMIERLDPQGSQEVLAIRKLNSKALKIEMGCLTAVNDDGKWVVIGNCEAKQNIRKMEELASARL